MPTLLVAGERDDIAPVAAQQELVGRLADARLVVLPGTGHLAHYEAPAAVAAAIGEFLDRYEDPFRLPLRAGPAGTTGSAATRSAWSPRWPGCTR